MERKELKRCYILQKDVYLIHEINRVNRGDRVVISGGRRRCSEANSCDKQGLKCKWVSVDYNFDGMNLKNLPPAGGSNGTP